MAATKIPYVNRYNGDIKIVTRQSAKRLSEDYSPAVFTTNDKGEDVMRIQLANATVDISENGEREVIDVDQSAE